VGQFFLMILWLLMVISCLPRISSISLFQKIFFLQDRTWPHTANTVLAVLNAHSDDRVFCNDLP
jgi:hypothetical protein